MGKRAEVIHLATDHGVESVAEVGVWSVTLSRGFAALPKLKELILIDPWTAELTEFEHGDEAYTCTMTTERIPPTQEKCDALCAAVTTHFADNPKVTILRMTSEEAAGSVPDGSLDMVYIDAIHLYEHVKHDIELWLPKLRKGGIISGDDYNIDEVRRAVDEFGGCTAPNQMWWKQI